MERIYLDHINQAPLRESVVCAVEKALRLIGNPSSLHTEGRVAVSWIQKARAQVASLVGSRAEEVGFTASATEANTWALTGLARARSSRGRHLVVSAVEHASILQTAHRMEREGWQVTVVPVDPHGRVDPDQLEKAFTPQTALVSVQWANPEVGTLQPVEEIARRAKAHGILFHSDAAAAAGRVPVSVKSMPVDALSLASNLLGGPAGAGALVLRKGVRIQPLFVGGIQEDGRRAGTENLLGIVGMGEAAFAAVQELSLGPERLTPLRERLIRGILKQNPEARLNGHPTERLPGHVSVSFPGANAEALVLALDLQGVAVGLGSACTARILKASHVLRAMGVADSQALGTVTLGLGLATKESEIDRFLSLLPKVYAACCSDHPQEATSA